MREISEEEWEWDNGTTTRMNKEVFLKKYKSIILEWASKNESLIIKNRQKYSYGTKSTLECINERNKVSQAIQLSRIRNQGGIDLKTADRLMDWGGFNKFPLRDPNEIIKITSEAFDFVEQGDVYQGIYKLMLINGVGIARASKIIGLFNQDKYCIYDSRVGTALRTLKKGDLRLILCPPGRLRKGDACSNKKWAENYEKLIWTLEVIRDYLNEKSHKFRIADIEMALFMMGE